MGAEEHKIAGERRFCPYCDEEIAEAAFPYCDACKVEVFYCPKCRQSLPRENKVCPHCGADIRAGAIEED